MNSLPWNLLDEILLRLDPKPLAMMRCTNKSMETHISNDQYFKSEYWSRIGTSLLHMGGYGSDLLCFHPYGDPRPFQNEDPLKSSCHILGCCSGLLLIFVDGCFCVANPLTKKFRLLDRTHYSQTTKCVGFMVDQVDPATQRFKIVCISEVKPSKPHKTMYQFQVYAGDSWRLSKTNIPCRASELRTDMKPVYFAGGLYWMRSDGCIVTFNTETEKARLIPIKFKQQVEAKLLLGAGDNCLTMISATEEVIYMYALKNFLTDPKWILTRRIMNEPVHQSMLSFWDVEAFDGRSLVVRTMKFETDHRVIYGYDLRGNKWEVVGLLPGWCDGNREFYQFKPSWSSVIGLPGQNHWRLTCLFTSFKSQSVSSIEGIMELINRNLRISIR